ncbi:MAG: fumarylacetoacetate hydrolase family protein [Oligoflexales bacterium]
MILATIRNGERDGQLIVVSSDYKTHTTSKQYPTLQSALDSWDKAVLELQSLAETLKSHPKDSLTGITFEAPLPRAYEWIDGSAFINHVRLVRKARGAEPPKTLETDPLVYQGGSGRFSGPCDSIPLDHPQWGLDFESEVCVIVDDVPMGTPAADMEQHIQLIMIANDVSLRGLIPEELAKGFGFVTSKPSTSFAPFTLTKEELGDAWKDGRLHLPLKTYYNDTLFGTPNAGPEMHFSFHEIIAHVAKTRNLTAGTIIGSGTISNFDISTGSSCLAEKRMIEKIETGEAKTPFMSCGDTVKIEMIDTTGRNLFGSIQQQVTSYQPRRN